MPVFGCVFSHRFILKHNVGHIVSFSYENEMGLKAFPLKKTFGQLLHKTIPGTTISRVKTLPLLVFDQAHEGKSSAFFCVENKLQGLLDLH